MGARTGSQKSSPPNEMSGSKRAVFTALLLVIPILFFIVVEGALRLTGFGGYPPLFIPVANTEGYLQPSPGVASRYFNSIEGMPSIPFDSFTRERDANSLRIFVQGGSTAAGYPFYFGGAMTDMLEHRLMQTFPDRSVEVVGTAMAAVNSYTLLDLADEIIEQQPDAVIIYAGHNEYYGALGVGSAESLGRSPRFVRTYLYLQKFRTVQAVRRIIASLYALGSGNATSKSTARTLMQRMVSDQQIPFGSTLYQAGLKQFESNMSLLLERYEENNIPVFIGTVASNLHDHPPFISSGPPDGKTEEWSEIESRIQFHATGPEPLDALPFFDDLLQLDSLSAATYYARARVYEFARDTVRARSDYLRAKEYDELRFRAPEAINDIIRKLADEHGASVVETGNALARASRLGIPGNEVMTEHLHPNNRGFFEMSDSFYDALVNSPVASGGAIVPSATARSESLLTEVDSLVAMYRISTLTSNWPFKPVGTPQAPLDTLGSGVVGDLALQLFKRDINRVDALDQLRGHYLANGEHRKALQVVFALIQRYPFWPNPYLSAASIMMNMGLYEEALLYARVSNDRGESAEALRLSGSLQLQLQRPSEAVESLTQALELEPGHETAMYNLAGAYALTGEFVKAAQYADRVLEINPGNEAARRLRGSLPVKNSPPG